jgi:hypothetical protein
MTALRKEWMVVILACAPAAWAADCPGVHSTLVGALSGTVTFSPNSTTWALTSGTATLQPADCNKKTSFRATPQSSLATNGTGSASVSSVTFPYQLQQASGPSWLTWGSLQSSAPSNGVVVDSNSTTATNARIIAGNSAPSFPHAGTYTDNVAISRDTILGNGTVDTVGIETLSPGISIAVPFQCVLTWSGNNNQLVLNYTSFGSQSPTTPITLNVQCNDNYEIGLADDNTQPSTATSLQGSAMGLSYTLTATGDALNGLPQLTAPGTLTINAAIASALPGDFSIGSCTQNEPSSPGGCARRSQTRTHYVVISK